MRISDYAGLSDVGSVRENNEDRWFADPAAGLFLVADGLGGHPAGEVAAQIAAEELPRLVASRRQILAEGDDARRARSLEAILRALNRTIWRESEANAARRGMGTTAVLVFVSDDTGIVASVGDCRVYLHRAGVLRQLTRDHSLAQYLLDNGMIAADDPRLSFARRQLLQHLGMATPPVPSLHKLPLAAGDRLLLCSDGLTDMVGDDEIAGVLEGERDARPACTALVDMAKLAGGRDNVTTVIVDFLE